MEARGEIHVPRRNSLSDDKPESPHLRDYLRIRPDESVGNDDGNNGRANSSGRTLGSVLKTEDRSGAPIRSQSSRTLLDVIREDPNGASNSKESRKRWRQFKEKLKLRRQGSGNAWTSSVPVPASDVPLQPTTSIISRNRTMMMSRRDSTRMKTPSPESSAQADVDLSSGVPRSRSLMLQRNESRAIHRAGRLDEVRGGFDEDREDDGEERAEEETEEEGEEEGGGGGDGQPERMSLMALLAETDGSAYMEEEDEDEEEEEEVERGGGGGGRGGYNNCCVCMVRHKGAAFIPCGHTFCRLCSRELWVQRGNCPLCNNFILEILDIF